MGYDPKAKRTRKSKNLTMRAVRSSPPGIYADAAMPTLNLLIMKNGSKRLARFVQRIVINGKQTTLGLGSHPVVTLEEARDLALDNRRLVRKGGDPRTSSKKAPTVAAGLEAVLAIRKPSWRDDKK